MGGMLICACCVHLDGDLYAYAGLLLYVRRFDYIHHLYTRVSACALRRYELFFSQWKYSVVGSVAPSQYRGIYVMQEIAIQVTRQILCNNVQKDNR